MQLRHVHTAACPTCGETEVVEERVQVAEGSDGRREVRSHSNRARWEHRRFLCGYGVVWTPNFHRDEQEYRCPKAPDVSKRKKVFDRVMGEIVAVLHAYEGHGDLHLHPEDVKMLERWFRSSLDIRASYPPPVTKPPADEEDADAAWRSWAGENFADPDEEDD